MDQGARLDQKRDRAVAKRRRKPNIKALTLRIRARIVSLARREVRVHRSTPLGAPISLSPLHQLYVSSIICHLPSAPFHVRPFLVSGCWFRWLLSGV